jgi:ribonuclease P protein component
MTAEANPLGRLKVRSEFERVAAEGRRIRSTHLGLSYLPNGLHQSRVGITVPERAAKAAVRRNRLRRIIRERLRTFAIFIAGGFDLVVYILTDPGRDEGDALETELRNLLQKTGLWVGEG